MPRDGSGIYSKPVGTTAVPNTTIESSKYNSTIDDLVTDANRARPVTAGGTGVTSIAAFKTAFNLTIGTDVQAYDAGLQSIAGLTTAADRLPYTTASDTYAVTTFTAFARTLLDDADASTALSTLGVSAYAKTILDDTTAGAVLTTLGVSAFVQTILDDADAATVRATIGANDAGNLTTGTVAAARLPATMNATGFAGTITAGSSASIVREVDTSLLTIAGGSSGNPGANIELYGGSHATVPSQAFYDANTHSFRQAAGSGTPTVVIGGNTVWHAGNDGAGSGLDADLLDGQSSAFYQAASTAWNTGNASDNSVTWFDDIPNPPAGRVRMPGRNASGDRVYVTIDSSTGAFISVTTY